MNSRLLHAAARGARIEHFHNGWVPSSEVDIGKWFQRLQRIHPDDEHLAYGPVSTALREIALYGQQLKRIPLLGVVKLDDDDYPGSLTWDDHRMYLLFNAEALADEGL